MKFARARCSIMDKQARSKKTTPRAEKELYDLYLRRHDRINNWDLVDVCSIHVVGGYLFDKPRKSCTAGALRRTSGSAARRSSAPHISFVKVSWTIPTRLPSC